MAFERLSEDFAKSLNKMADDLKAKKQYGSHLGSYKFAQAPGDPGQDPKQQSVAKVLSSIQQFNDRMVKEWLFSLEDGEIQEVGRVFEEINQFSAGDLQQLSASSPFELVGSMFKQDGQHGEHGGGCGGGGHGAEVVMEVEAPIDSPAADIMLNKGAPKHEGAGPGIA